MLHRKGIYKPSNRPDICIFCSVLLSTPTNRSRTQIARQSSRYLTGSQYNSGAVASAITSPDEFESKPTAPTSRGRTYGGLFQSMHNPSSTAHNAGDPANATGLSKSPRYRYQSRGSNTGQTVRPGHLEMQRGLPPAVPPANRIPPIRYTDGLKERNRATRSQRVDLTSVKFKNDTFPTGSSHANDRKTPSGRIKEAFRNTPAEGPHSSSVKVSAINDERVHSKASVGWGSLPTQSDLPYRTLSSSADRKVESGSLKMPSSTVRFVAINQKRPLRCFLCNSEDHLASNCPQQIPRSRPSFGGRSSQNNTSSIANPRPASVTQCYICKEEGHNASNCPRGPAPYAPALAAEPQHGRSKGSVSWTSAISGDVAVRDHPTVIPISSTSVGNGEKHVGRRRRSRFDESNLEEAPVKPKLDSHRQARTINKDEEKYHDEDFDDEYLDEAFFRSQRKRKKNHTVQRVVPKTPVMPMPIVLPEFISVANLANALGVRLEDFLAKMEGLGFVEVAHDQILTSEDAGLIAQEYGYEAKAGDAETSQDIFPAPARDDLSDLPQRPPVVTIMGHVDHGKTTILDYLRKSSVAATEHGGITQHIGAFVVPLSSGKMITFLDTPGHAAFLSMRQRGATVTDIVVLVVAGDDSVMPQTVEAINHAKAAGVPIIVAINKCDKEDSNPDRVKKDLSRHGIDVEDFGGDTQSVCVSGKTGKGMQELEEAIITLGEILDHRAAKDGQVEGWVLEATTKDRGKVATVLVRRGTLEPGNILVAGTAWARVRSLRNEAGLAVKQAGPGTPIEVDGWRELPKAGDEALQAPSESKAAAVVEYRQTQADRLKMAEDMEAINLSRRMEQEKRQLEATTAKARGNGAQAAPLAAEEADVSPGVITVPLIVKADVAGSAEAVVHAISGIGNSEIKVKVLRGRAGPVTPSDVDYASTVGANIIAFNTSVPPQILGQAQRTGVKVLSQSIIYRVVEDVTALLSSQLAPVISSRVLGEAEIAQIFEIRLARSKTSKIAGCKVRNGLISSSAKIRVLRKREIIYDGSLASLKNVKKDVTQMRKDTECGMGFTDWEGFEVGDQVQAYETVEEKRYL